VDAIKSPVRPILSPVIFNESIDVTETIDEQELKEKQMKLRELENFHRTNNQNREEVQKRHVTFGNTNTCTIP
jgi:hypothetical protein|tara:strand:+ start:409 stop:627 length:219 start_codon:yes stop_codon:yes gene_type:complete